MEMLKRKLKVFWAVAVAVVILLGGVGTKEVLAHMEVYEGFTDGDCKDWYMTVNGMATIDSEADAGRLNSFRRLGTSRCYAPV